jgi:2-hydroxychromene-2-carboxylate isomerase
MRKAATGQAKSSGMPARLTFWYEFASTYSYIAACRIERLAAAAGVDIVWQPFLLGPIFATQGWDDSPFNLYPAKGRYMWRDLERLAARDGLSWRRPSRFPCNGLLAARVALVGMHEGWGVEFSKRALSANFAEDRDIGTAQVLGDILATLGQDPALQLARAATPGIKDALRARTAEAERLGIFGAATFEVGGEIFWGQDRLEESLAWAKNPSSPTVPSR